MCLSSIYQRFICCTHNGSYIQFHKRNVGFLRNLHNQRHSDKKCDFIKHREAKYHTDKDQAHRKKTRASVADNHISYLLAGAWFRHKLTDERTRYNDQHQVPHSIANTLLYCRDNFF